MKVVITTITQEFEDLCKSQVKGHYRTVRGKKVFVNSFTTSRQKKMVGNIKSTLKTVDGIDLDAMSGYDSFESGEALTYREVLLGQKALDLANNSGEEFEGWVHISGPPEQFLKERDPKMEKLHEANKMEYYGDTLVVTEQEVRNAYKSETGKNLPR